MISKEEQINEDLRLTSRNYHEDDTELLFENSTIGGKNIAIIAGPCSVESEDQIISIAEKVKKSGASFLRGGAYKPRTSPYSFQGLKEDGLELLKLAKIKTDLPIVTELLSVNLVEKVSEYADIIQIGARNMQNVMVNNQLH